MRKEGEIILRPKVHSQQGVLVPLHRTAYGQLREIGGRGLIVRGPPTASGISEGSESWKLGYVLEMNDWGQLGVRLKERE